MFESEEKQAAALAAALNTAAGECAVRILENGSVSTVELLSSTGAGASPTHTTRHALGLKGIRTGTVMVERKTAFVYIKLHLTQRKEVGVATCYARMRTTDGASEGPAIDTDQVRWEGGTRDFPAAKSKAATA